MSERKAVNKSADMSDEMQADAIGCATQVRPRGPRNFGPAPRCPTRARAPTCSQRASRTPAPSSHLSVIQALEKYSVEKDIAAYCKKARSSCLLGFSEPLARGIPTHHWAHLRPAGLAGGCAASAKDCLTWGSDRPGTPSGLKKYRQSTLHTPGVIYRHYGAAQDAVDTERTYGKARAMPGRDAHTCAWQPQHPPGQHAHALPRPPRSGMLTRVRRAEGRQDREHRAVPEDVPAV